MASSKPASDHAAPAPVPVPALTSQQDTALRTWEAENDVRAVDDVFRYDKQDQAAVREAKPWRNDPRYFKSVRISSLALLKMAMHCKSGGNLEVMGLMQGKTVGRTFVVLDAFALPVEGTETRVNAQAEAVEYMVEYVQAHESTGRFEQVVGWYHSHPGYGCWMSGVDCATQITNQAFQEPFLAVVVDPVRTMAAGKVEIGAFRTYPEGYTPPDDDGGAYQTIPLDKIEDFGVHAKQYYQLDVSFFKSSLDDHLLRLLWQSYWQRTLSSSSLLLTSAGLPYAVGQLRDVAEKLEKAESGSGGVLQSAMSMGVNIGAGGFGHGAAFGSFRGMGAGAGGEVPSAGARADRLGLGSRASAGAGGDRERRDGGGAGQAAARGANNELAGPPPNPLDKVVRDSSKALVEHIMGMTAQMVKSELFDIDTVA